MKVCKEIKICLLQHQTPESKQSRYFTSRTIEDVIKPGPIGKLESNSMMSTQTANDLTRCRLLAEIQDIIKYNRQRFRGVVSTVQGTEIAHKEDKLHSNLMPRRQAEAISPATRGFQLQKSAR